MVSQVHVESELVVSPARALNDQPLSIRLSGLEPGARAAIGARLVDDFGRSWESNATFQADSDGTIRVEEQSPVGGTYEGVEAMGLFWSMKPVDSPMVNGAIKNTVAPTTVAITAEVNGAQVAAVEIERLFAADGVERLPIREDGLVGTLFLPAGDGPFPGMLVFTGSGGGMEEGRAALLASHGFAAFALAYFHAEGLPDDLIDIPLEYFETGLAWMNRHPKVRGNRIGVIGGSRGGELVLLLGSTFPAIKAVVAFVPSGVVWRGFGKSTDEIEGDVAAWRHHGTPVPSMPRESDEVELDIAEGVPIPLTPYFLKSMESKESIEAARIPVERIAAPVLMISGEADAMWPSTQLAEIAVAGLRDANHPYAFEHVSYPNAGHSIRAPYIPTAVTDMQHPVDGGLYALGGTPEGNARANEDSWRRVLQFLNEHLGGSV